MAEQKDDLPEIIKKLAVTWTMLSNAEPPLLELWPKRKMELALAQQELEKAEKKYKKEDAIIRNLEFLQENLENAKQQCLEKYLQRGFHHRSLCSLRPTICFHLGAKLPDKLNIMSKQQQKKNVVEYQRQAQAKTRADSMDSGLGLLTTAPPASLLAPISYNMLQPSPSRHALIVRWTYSFFLSCA